MVRIDQVHGQTTTQDLTSDITGTWQGTLHTPRADLRSVMKIAKTDAGGLKFVLYSIDQGTAPFPVSTITRDGSAVKYTIAAYDLKYEGKLSVDGKEIEGSTTQHGYAFPLNYTRATPKTAWKIPEHPAELPPMAADADPRFKVVTIKPSPPHRPGKLFTFKAGHFITFNTNLMISSPLHMSLMPSRS